MNISPMNSCNFGKFGYYGKPGPVLEDVYENYSSRLKDGDVIYIKNKNGIVTPVLVGNLRTLAIQEQHPNYRYIFGDSDLVESVQNKDGNKKITAGDIRKEFAQEEKCVAETRGYIPVRKIDYYG